MNDGCSGTPCTFYSAHGLAIISACRKYSILRSVNNIWTLTNKIKCTHSKKVIAKLLFKFWLAYEIFVDMAIEFDQRYETIYDLLNKTMYLSLLFEFKNFICCNLLFTDAKGARKTRWDEENSLATH